MDDRNLSKVRALIKKRLKEGRGQGCGAEYKPWIRVREVPSHGLSSRILGLKTKRVHHFLSNLERDYFFILDLSVPVIDIREQYPLLPLDSTLELARRCKFRHPMNPKKREIVVMTTDFVITVAAENGPIEYARTVKPFKQLQQKRVREKLEIERRYWEEQNILWGVVTEREIHPVVARNASFLRRYVDLTYRLSLHPTRLHEVAVVLTAKVKEGQDSLWVIAHACDRQFELQPGSALVIAYHLLATHQWHIDLSTPLEPRRKIVLLAAMLQHLND